MTAARSTPSLRGVTDSLGAPAELLGVLDRLFAGVSALGSSPRLVARLLADAGVKPRHRVLDLGCGKGAVGVQVARRIGCRVVGVDRYGPFIEAARELSRRHGVGGVAGLCRWEVGDMQAARRRFDAAMMIGGFSIAKGVPLLRRFVRPGGVYVIDDAIRNPRHKLGDPHGPYADAPDATETAAIIERTGDRVERRVMLPKAAVQAASRRIITKLSTPARELGRTHPHLRDLLREYLHSQRESARLLVGPLRPTIWVVRRL